MKKQLNIIGAVVLLVTVGIFVLGGPSKTVDKLTDKKSSDQKSPSSSNVSETSEVAELKDVPVLEPVSAEQFGGFKAITEPVSSLNIQNPNPTRVGAKVDTSLYQGVVYKDSESTFRVLIGKLTDKSQGLIELSDAFELVLNKSSAGSNDISLRRVTPSTLEIESIKIVRWANLPNDDQMVEAIKYFKAANPNQ